MDFLVFVLLAPLTLCVIASVSVLAKLRLPNDLRRAFLVLSGVEAGWIATSAAQVLVASPAAMVALTEVMYVFTMATALAWIWFALLYARRWSARTRAWLLAFAAESAAFLALTFTNDRHGLIWARVDVEPVGTFQTLELTFGPLLLPQAALTWAAMLTSIVLILASATHQGPPRRALSRWIAAGVAVPVLLHAALVTGVWDVGKDFSPIALALSSAVVGVALVRGRALDLRPLARAALVERLREGMMVLDAESQVVDVNPALRAMLGRPERLLGRHVGEVLTPAQRVAAEPLWGEQTAQAEIPFEVDGERRYYDLSISPIAGPDGERAGRIVLVYDVTELKEQQDALERANGRLQRQNAELDAFAHTVAHDLKTSIQHLVGHAELLHEDGPRLTEAEHRDLASGLVRAGLKLDTVVQELLLFSTSGRGAVPVAPLEMGAVFEEALARLRPVLDATGAHVSVISDWPEVLGYAAWVEAVWYNYLSNAAKYGGHPDGTPARITVYADAPGPDGQVRFWVQDDGPGLGAATRGRLFAPFTRLPEAAKVEGYGIGLSIVQRVVERLGGACGVESAGVPGEGSRFWFSLPAVPATRRGGPPHAYGAADAADVST